MRKKPATGFQREPEPMAGLSLERVRVPGRSGPDYPGQGRPGLRLRQHS